MSKPNYKTQIETALAAAREHRGARQSIALAGGLQVEILFQQGCYHLELSRPGHYPSLQDWAQALRAWPGKVEALPEKRRRYGRYYLSAVWPTPQARTPRFSFPSGQPDTGR